jgi:hypothetical protein
MVEGKIPLTIQYIVIGGKYQVEEGVDVWIFEQNKDPY